MTALLAPVEIYEIMGGEYFMEVMGFSLIEALDYGMKFHLPKAIKEAETVEIEFDEVTETFTLTFFERDKREPHVERYGDLTVEELKEAFMEFTGIEY